MVSADACAKRSRDRIRAVRSWAYQLQKVDLQTMANSPYDMVVIDYATDELTPWPPDAIEQIRRGGSRRRIVLAYLSIGEAESYRPYWRPEWKQKSPKWLGPMNRRWQQNYAVRFWQDGWRQILLGPGGYLDTIVAQGFDGIYVDRVDAYERWGPTGEGKQHQQANMAAMAALVADLAHHARGKPGQAGFLVVAQNAPELAALPGYLDVVDGVALEDLLYRRGKRRSKRSTRWAMKHVRPITGAGHPVFAVDYFGSKRGRRRYHRRIKKLGLIPFAAPSTELDRLP